MSTSKTDPAGAPAPELTPEKANQIMACIYWDINCAAKFINLPQASQTEEDKTIIEILRANQQSFVDLVVYEYVKALESGPTFSKTVEDTVILRFIRDHGWKIFSMCSYSEAFQWACQDKKEILAWWLVEKMIGENLRSIELFARCRSLDWRGPLLQHARWCPQLRRTLDPELRLGDEHPHHTVRMLDGSLQRPRFNHQPQVHINQHIYKADKCNNAPNPILRKPEWGACALCASTDICNCRVTPTADDAVEIIEYPSKGLGIRALSNFRKGDWLGEFLGCIIPVENMSGTTIYDLEQVVWEKSFAGEPSKNPQAKGKKRLRTIAYIAPAHQGNWTRFMNHSCDSNVNFRHTIVGKYATTIVEAKRDIAIFEDITVNYGKNYWTAAGRICRCGSDECIHRERQGRDLQLKMKLTMSRYFSIPGFWQAMSDPSSDDYPS